MTAEFFEISVYEKDGWLYAYAASITCDKGYFIHYPCSRIRVDDSFSNIGEVILSASARVENGIDKTANSNSEILSDLGKKSSESFTKGVRGCLVVKNKGRPDELQIHEGVRKRGGFEFTNKKSVFVSLTSPTEIGESVVKALGSPV